MVSDIRLNNNDTITLQGRVGAGTDNPQAAFHVYSGDNPTVLRIQSAGGFGAARVEFWSDPLGSSPEWRPGFIQSTDQAGGTWTGGLAFFVNGTGFANRRAAIEVMRLTQGNVGIGTSTPAFKLDVADRIRVRQGATGTAGIWLFQAGSDRAFVGMAENDEVGFWGNTGIGWGLRMNTTTGNIRTAGTITQASSRALKENIAHLSSQTALQVLQGLNPVTFNYKANPTQKPLVGFIAEDVPDLVATPDRKGLGAMEIVAVLTKAVQLQQKMIAELVTEMQSIKATQQSPVV